MHWGSEAHRPGQSSLLLPFGLRALGLGRHTKLITLPITKQKQQIFKTIYIACMIEDAHLTGLNRTIGALIIF